ncbi:hypothetical protein C5745_05820 [Sphingobacterium haloxyli]|uniref:Uncharacterized protein n=1 Tax=Sphingobacterium haloxyli TaxID=2100533 RepID=A0A2S9J5L5_9SPHI|nr:hypothetical protein C5745_05820 [Sphingobacterium haloxyli]
MQKTELDSFLTMKGSHTEFLRSRYQDITPEIIYKCSKERISLLKDTQNITRTIAIFRFNRNTWSESLSKLNTDVENGFLINDAIKLHNLELLRQPIKHCKISFPDLSSMKRLKIYEYSQLIKIYIKKEESIELYGNLYEIYHPEILVDNIIKNARLEFYTMEHADIIIDMRILELLNSKLI